MDKNSNDDLDLYVSAKHSKPQPPSNFEFKSQKKGNESIVLDLHTLQKLFQISSPTDIKYIYLGVHAFPGNCMLCFMKIQNSNTCAV